MDKVAIIAVIYQEEEWDVTERCLLGQGVPLFYVDRGGSGSMAKALNGGFEAWSQGFEYVWFVTNVTFGPECLPRLLESIKKTGWAAISPTFPNSDHEFIRKTPDRSGVREVPYIEFTAPLVRSYVFKRFPLDERMPYWGHDLDWGHRLRCAGFTLGVDYEAEIQHKYIRHLNMACYHTRVRMQNRRGSNRPTADALIEKYGLDWRKVLKYFPPAQGRS